MNGIINIYKEPGFTSHDVVAKLRGILHQKKIGHTGTLDPAASGVLPVCCGNATKVCGLLTDKDKSYHAICRLGIETDTQDMEGRIIRECSTEGITKEDIINCVKQFEGEIMQVPPMYSAIKSGGKRLYELAREGKTIERPPRKITIHSINVTDIDIKNSRFSMDITCSKGTYIRTLCHDTGIKLNNAAAMEKLVRTRVSIFKIENAVTLKEIQKIAECQPEKLKDYFMPVDAIFAEYKKAQIKSSFSKKLANGNKLSTAMLNIEEAAKTGENILVYNENGAFKAIYTKEGKEYKVNKMF